MSTMECIGLHRYSIGHSATGITLPEMGIVWKPGVRCLIIRNISTTNIYVTDGSAVPVATSFVLLPGISPGMGNELKVYGTPLTFAKMPFNMVAGETGLMNVQQSNELPAVT